MAEGTQSKEGLFEIMSQSMEDNDFSAKTATIRSIAIIETLPEEIRADKFNLDSVLRRLAKSLIETADKL